MESAHGPLARISLCAPAGKMAGSLKTARGPLHAKTISASGWETARSRKRSTGPLALGASRAPGRNLGLGWERLTAPGLNLGPVSVSRPSQSDGRARFSAEQNRIRRPSRRTLASFLFFSALSRTPQRRLRANERRRRERARGAARAPRRCARSPLGERAAVEWPQRRFFAPARPDEAASSAPSRSCRRRRSRGGAPTRSQARPHAGERWSGSTRASHRSTTHGSADDGGREEIRVRTLAPLCFSFFFFSFFFLSFFFYLGHGEAA
jgi:hypothetical protein